MSPVLLALIASPAWAQVRFNYTYSSEDTYTDNVNLAPAGLQRTAWTTDVRPTVAVTSNGAGLRLNAAYSPQLLYRVNDKTQDIYHFLNANAAAELVRQTLFLNAGTSISQVNTSLLSPQTDNNVNRTGNRTSVRTFNVSPSLRPNFGPEVQGSAILTYSKASYESAHNGVDNAQTIQANGSTSEASGIALTLASGPAYKLTTWSVAYSKNRTEGSQGSGVSTSDKIVANAGRLITPNLRLIANVGYTSSNNSLASVGGVSNNSGLNWSTGLDWTPTPRTRLAATTGRTYYDTSTYSLDFNHNTALSVWSAGYHESVTTTHAQALRPELVNTASFLEPLFIGNYPDPVAREKAIKDYIAQNGLASSVALSRNFLTDQTFLTKQLNFSVGMLGRRNTVLASAFRTKSQSDSIVAGAAGAGDFGSSSTVNTTGGSLTWTSRITQHTSSNANLNYTRTEFPGIGSGRADTTKTVNVGITQQMLPRMSGTLSYRKLKSDSSQSSASYTENAVVAALRLQY